MTRESSHYHIDFFVTHEENLDALLDVIREKTTIPVGFKIITPGSNMLIGLATEGTNCKFEFEKSLTSHFLIDFVATMYFGTQFESISKERLLLGYDEIPTE